MLNLSSWLTFLLISMSAAFSPGPAVLMAVNTAGRLSVRHAVFSSLGNAVGLIFLSLMVISGLSYVLVEFDMAFGLLKILGAAYLIFLGLKQIYKSFSRVPLNADLNSELSMEYGRLGLFRQGLLVALSNPKAILFLSAVLPQFLSMKHVQFGQFCILMATFIFCSFLSHGFYIYLSLLLGKVLQGQVWIVRVNRMFGALFVVVGVSLLGVDATIRH